jgi:hypothetical protein
LVVGALGFVGASLLALWVGAGDCVFEAEEGNSLEKRDGGNVGTGVGLDVRLKVGFEDGREEGSSVGSMEGLEDGACVGFKLPSVGEADGEADGTKRTGVLQPWHNKAFPL